MTYDLGLNGVAGGGHRLPVAAAWGEMTGELEKAIHALNMVELAGPGDEAADDADAALRDHEAALDEVFVWLAALHEAGALERIGRMLRVIDDVAGTEIGEAALVAAGAGQQVPA